MVAAIRRSVCVPGAAIALGTMLLLAGSASASAATPSTPLARVRSSVHRTEATGSAHFAIAISLTGAGRKQLTTSTGDARFPGPDVSLVIRVSTSGSSDAQLSDQVAIGKDFYTRYVSPSGAPAPWSKGTTRQPYAYLGAIEPSTLAAYRGPVKVLGTGTVTGEPATEYALAFPEATRVLPIRGSKTQHILVKSFTLHLWLNRVGEIVRTTAAQSETDNGTTIRSTTTATLFNFGEPVHIVAPQPLVSS